MLLIDKDSMVNQARMVPFKQKLKANKKRNNNAISHTTAVRSPFASHKTTTTRDLVDEMTRD